MLLICAAIRAFDVDRLSPGVQNSMILALTATTHSIVDFVHTETGPPNAKDPESDGVDWRPDRSEFL